MQQCGADRLGHEHQWTAARRDQRADEMLFEFRSEDEAEQEGNGLYPN